MGDEQYTPAMNFSLVQNGVFHKLLVRIKMAGPSTREYLTRLAVICGIVWFPLLILCSLQGLAFGNKVEIPFIKDFGNHIRFLLIIPLLVFAERSVDYRLRELSNFFFTAGILNENDIPAFNKIKQLIVKLSASVYPDLVILLVVTVNIIVRWIQTPDTSSFWLLIPDYEQKISWAGIWYLFISLPIFQYMFLRWFWRWILWVIYFKKIANLPLKLNVAHPDRAGGLGFLGVPPAPFLSVTLAFSILCSVTVAQQIFFFHGRLPQYYILLGGVAILAILLNVLPLLVFMKTLFKQRRKGIFEYSALIQEHHREFDQKWIYKKNNEQILGTSDPSSMIDINSSFDSVMAMKLFPFDIKIMLSTILIVILPILPLAFFEYDLADLLKQILKLFL